MRWLKVLIFVMIFYNLIVIYQKEPEHKMVLYYALSTYDMLQL